MTQEIKLKDEVVVLSTQKEYSGESKPSDDEKLVRKAIGLPVTKQLVFYTNKRKADSFVRVTHYRLMNYQLP